MKRRRFPPLTFYSLFHSDGAFPYGSNYVVGFDCNGYPNYPYLDWLLEQAKNAPSHEEILYYTKLALGYITELAITTPLWTSLAYWAYSRNVFRSCQHRGVWN